MEEYTNGHCRVPRWGWALAALTFPVGPFIAFGAARVLSWRSSIVLAAMAYGSIAGYVLMEISFQDRNASAANQSASASFGIVLILIWAAVIWWLGQRANYWSAKLQRGWRRAGWFGVVILLLALLNVAVRMISQKPADY